MTLVLEKAWAVKNICSQLARKGFDIRARALYAYFVAAGFTYEVLKMHIKVTKVGTIDRDTDKDLRYYIGKHGALLKGYTVGDTQSMTEGAATRDAIEQGKALLAANGIS